MSKIKTANQEVKKLVGQLKKAQSNLQSYLKKNDILDEAKKYADKQGKELKKIISADANKVKAFIEKEKATLEQFQKQIPSEVEKLKKFLLSQRGELEKVLNTIKQNAASKAPSILKTKKKAAKKKTVKKQNTAAGKTEPTTDSSMMNESDSVRSTAEPTVQSK